MSSESSGTYPEYAFEMLSTEQFTRRQKSAGGGLTPMPNPACPACEDDDQRNPQVRSNSLHHHCDRCRVLQPRLSVWQCHLSGPPTQRGSLQVMIGAIPSGAGASHSGAMGRTAFGANEFHKSSYELIPVGLISSKNFGMAPTGIFPIGLPLFQQPAQ
jgi:hypothetical protein